MTEQTTRAHGAGSTDPLHGRVLDGRYRIEGLIARGGMARVYTAHDERLDRTVAVKVMRADLGDDEQFAARFVREARAAARLSHPNIVAVFDQGEDDGTVFLAMEYIPGRTLRDVIAAEAPLSPARALAVLEPVVSALAAAHRADIMHRDVKPENVLLADDGRVKVADFGLAKAISADTSHTATGILIGTVSYVAPELVVHGTGDARADVYAVGVILSELLTGRKPHQGESPIQVAYKHVHEDVPPPSRVVPSIPPYLDALVARATARDVTQRPADAGVLLRHLHLVQQALAAGVADDPDLTADLTPRVVSGTAELVGLEEIRERLVEEDDPLALPDLGEHTQRLAAMAPAAGATGSAVTAATAAVTVRPVGPIEPVAPLPPPRRRRRRGPLALFLAVLLAVAVGVGAWWFGYARYTSLPSVLDLTQAQATSKLQDAGFEVEIGTPVYSDDVAKGRVVSTDPDPGSRVLDGDTVTLVVSLGVEQYPVPKLAGLTLEAATKALTDTKLEVGLVTRAYSETVAEGEVISSDPAAGEQLRPGAAVDLVVSKGRRPIPVGDWVGKDADRAQKVLERRGLVVDRRTTVYSDTVPEGFVVSQSPTGGTLFRGETVNLTVSLGPELVEMPRVIGSGVEAAREKLEALGFKVEVQNSRAYIGLGYVLSSDPDAGQQVPKGSTVTLYLV
ncbi:Stk1 family PASTA domain-containing Ser/Thr kinase [Nocardioides fonticola]|uniref:non-specific serine/threonine protein kinase n=1 Tax=Nocardioides fonticola TaxID=450363 RepID=A0ABP7X9L2_9ACTN